MDYKRLKRAAGKKEVAFDFVATQRSIVNPLIDTLQSIGLTVVAVDVDKNSLMRVCQHCTKSKKSSMLIEIDDERSMLSVKGDCGTSHTLSLSLGEKPLIEKIQQELDIESAAKAKSILQEAENEPNPKSEEVIAAQVLLNEFYETVLQKARELQQQNQQEGCSDIETLFIVELGRKWAGLKEVLKKNFPKAKLLEQFECIRIPEKDQKLYFNAIGLALRAIMPEAHAHTVNLLPHDKKEELRASKIKPILSAGLLLVFIAIAGVTILSGVTAAKTYFDYMTSQKELVISREKVANPYLAQIAQASQQKTQLENQVKTILNDNLPVAWVMQRVDGYNLNGIGLVNVGYKIGLDGNMSLHIRAKTASRENTEKFIIKLENDPVFSEVNSPLSNLVGKGERFIQIDFILDRNWMNFDDTAETSDDAVETADLPSAEEADQPDTAETSGDANELTQ